MIKNQESLRSLLHDLENLPTSERAFNPYDPAFPGAQTRRDNLERYLTDMLVRQPTHLIVFEAPGYNGCALSGIPVTSERIMLRGIKQWGLFGEGYHSTSGHPNGVAEMTATILWSTLEELADSPALIWNTVPLHPHKPDQRQSNRPPTQAEKSLGLEFLSRVLKMFTFRHVMAAGRTAQWALAELEVGASPLRHPAQGGKPEFVRGIKGVYLP